MPLSAASHVPRCTYRVQLHGKFTFDDARARLGYLRALGISDLYLSPIFTALPGSTHGYDVSDFRTVNAELGGRDGFVRLTDQLRAEGMGALVDFVPNHMGIADPQNRWWRDVLERGRQSPYASYFDIKWNAEQRSGPPRVLVPILEDHYGKVLEKGKIRLGYDGAFSIGYHDVALPMSPRSYASILAPLTQDAVLAEGDRATLAALVNRLAAELVPAGTDAPTRQAHAAEVEHAKTELHAFLAARPPLAEWIAARIAAFNGVPGDPGSFAALHGLLDLQHYRLARWKTGTHDINYRRFFAIDSLVGLRVERPEVFQAAHAGLAELIAEGRVAGLRIDHIDGLRQPETYLRALQSFRPARAAAPLYVVVEKILAPGETLPATWATHGTTGYEFIPQLAGIFTAATAARFDAIYGHFTGEAAAFADVVYAKKRLIISVLFENAVSNLGADLTELVSADWRWQDLTRHELTTAVSETMACFPVYRTYRRDRRRASPADQRVLEAACAEAIARNPLADPQPFEFVRDLLIGIYPPEKASDYYHRQLLAWVLTFQQYTGAVMAKAVEDTAFYTYCRLVGANEVGGEPGRLGGTAEEFHAANRARLAHAPHSLLTTSTHDTKFSEDVRARLYALSEIADEWQEWLDAWHGLNARHRSPVNGQPAPDPVDEYRFYQVLLGAWPLDEAEVDDAFRTRLREHLRKAVDEAKRHTFFLHPNHAYHAACERFVDAVLAPAAAGGEFATSLRQAAQRLAPLGMVNSLSQVILKCTVPGVPDFYQGNETWDFSLVDPDNRRAVDYARRETLLARGAARSPAELLEHWRDGGIKLWTMQTLLRFRAAQPALFARGAYHPAVAAGAFADHVVAFSREHAGRAIVAVVPRLTARLGAPPTGAVWDDTRVSPAGAPHGWRDLFTAREFPPGADLPVRALFADLPFAVLESLPPSSS